MQLIKNFYEKIQGDYDDVKLRLPTDEIVLRFLKRFPNDSTYQELLDAIENEDIKESFDACHKLKGIVANLSFSKFYKSTFELCEQLRPLNAKADEALVKNVARDYEEVMNAIKELED